MTATVVSFRWLDILEKEFDKSFVDLDLILGDIEDSEDGECINQCRSKLGALSSCFAQLAHKAQTIFQTNAKLEAELLNLRHELAELEANQKILKEENHDMLMQLHASQLKLHRTSSINDSLDSEDTEKIRERLEKDLEEERARRLSIEIPKEELVLLRRENELLRKHILSLQGELSGAKLTSKYLDKELAGRIQQLQLLSRELSGDQHEKLWRQLEAEIHLHRHKTVVRACRTNNIQSPESETRNCINGSLLPPKPLKTQQHRVVTLHKGPNQGLGMSITGGREHGVPILISVLYNEMPAGACQQLFVGDAILSVNGRSLKDVCHSEAVEILSSLEGEITLEVMYISPDEDDDISVSLDDPMAFRYRMFDDEVASVVSSLQLLQNGRLSRASIDSIRGSTDNILESPRPSLIESTTELAQEIEEDSQLDCPPSNIGLKEETQLSDRLAGYANEGEPPDDTSSDHNSGRVGNLEPNELAVKAVVDCVSGEEKESDDNLMTPFIERNKGVTNHAEEVDNQESLRLIDKSESKEPPLLPESSLTSQDVFNSNY